DAPVDQRKPLALPGEAVVFASDAGGKTDLWFLQNGRVKRITDFATALGGGNSWGSSPGFAPNGLYAVAFYGARFRLFEVSSPDFISADEQDAIPPAYLATLDKPLPFPDEPIPFKSPTYDPYDLGKNWRI